MNTLRCFVASIGTILFLVPFTQVQAQTAVQDDPRIEKLLSQLTLAEKISLLGGTGFETVPIPRLGIPALKMTDGPAGVRWQQSSAFPASIMMAASWNTPLIENLGAAIARETRAKGRQMLLGPCLNIHRTPFGGRNFESYGEDPFLAARMAVAFVKGVQASHVVATAKHFACNNQEYERMFTNVTVSERALREIYLPAFEAAVTEGGVMSVMSAYNKVNGKWCAENPVLLKDILKKEWGFRGFVVSDWGGVNSTVPSINAGLDVEMPTGKYLNAGTILPAIKDGLVSETAITEMVRRLLRTMVWVGLLDGADKTSGELNSARHRALALDVARDGTVLLKNEGQLLPLHPGAIKTLAVIGPNAAQARTGGGGSSHVEPIYAISPYDALRQRLSPGIDVRYVAGCRAEGSLDPVPPGALRPPGAPVGVNGLKGEYFPNPNLKGSPLLIRVDPSIDFNWGDGKADNVLRADSFSVRWTGTITASRSGKHALQVFTDDGVRLYINGALLIDNWSQHAAEMRNCTVEFVSGNSYDIKIEYFDNSGGAVMRFGWDPRETTLLSEAARTAAAADAVVLCVGLSEFSESEGFDRAALSLPRDQVELIKAVTAANKKTIVALNGGAPILMDEWLAQVPALLMLWYPGEEGGTALADVLLGTTNPSGKLPMTFLKRWEDSPAYGNYPGTGAVNYAEGVFVGYRHFDRNKTEVLFPFGYGLSYTTFSYANLNVVPQQEASSLTVKVTMDVKNTGTRTGAEVVQLYVSPPTSPVERPVKELKGFQKVTLEPGATATVSFTLDYRSFAYFDEVKKAWTMAPGTYQVVLGPSSRETGQLIDLVLQ